MTFWGKFWCSIWFFFCTSQNVLPFCLQICRQHLDVTKYTNKFCLDFFSISSFFFFFASGAYAPGSRIAFPSFHALVTCDHARIIWDAVRVNWPLPPNNLLIHNVKEWLLHVLAVCSVNVQDRIIMLIWRIWQLPNDVVHGKQIPPLQTTVDFLDSYFKSLQLAQNYSTEEILKVKLTTMAPNPVISKSRELTPTPWPPPPAGWMAVSVDGSYSVHGGAAAAGMVMVLSSLQLLK